MLIGPRRLAWSALRCNLFRATLLAGMQDRRLFARTLSCGSRWGCALGRILLLALLLGQTGSTFAQSLSQRFLLGGQK